MSGAPWFAPWVAFATAVGGVVLVVFYLAALAWQHRRNLAAIGLRIHVGGTRGKSATVRLVASGLRARGLRVVAKTTGTEPRLILPNGRETAWLRWGAASIGEQMRLVQLARETRADALVAECMAIRPELVRASESRLLRAHVAVITNTHPDHLEDLGGEATAMADAVAQMIPSCGRVFITDRCYEAPIVAMAAARGSELHRVEVAGLRPPEANRRLAEAVCVAVAGPLPGPMLEATHDPGAFRLVDVERGGRTARLALAFSCNDPASLRALWEAYGPAPDAPIAFLFNGRADRPLRSRHMLRELHDLRGDARLFLAGTGPLRRLARAAGFERQSIVDLRGQRGERVLDRVVSECPPPSIIWGVGNYRGAGATITAAAAAGSEPC
jgi:poly-gamma-glutamate synthase PgsB/CapB